jgi:predicted nucleic acid-binding protein
VAVLVDTNILLRLSNLSSALHPLVRRAADTLIARDEALCFTTQNLIEMWGTCTRPEDKNGLGLTIAETEGRVAAIEESMLRLPEDDRIYPVWRRLVREHSVSGAQVHHARLAAAMIVHQVPSILTLNGRDFIRYPGISVIDPNSLQ